jgi:hypothetical protein
MKDSKVIVALGGSRNLLDGSAACYYIHAGLDEIERRTGVEVVVHIGDCVGFDECAARYFSEFFLVRQAIVSPPLTLSAKPCPNADRLSVHRWSPYAGSERTAVRALAGRSRSVFQSANYAFTVHQDGVRSSGRGVAYQEKLCQSNRIPCKSIFLNEDGVIRMVMTSVTSLNRNNSMLNLWHQEKFAF